MARRSTSTPPVERVELKPLTPQKAIDDFIADRRTDTSYETRRTYKSALSLFVDWTDEEEISNMNVIGGRELRRFKGWRKENSSANTVSLNGNLSVVKTFVGFCEDIEAVRPGTASRVPMPNVSDEEEVCEESPSDEQVDQALSYLNEFHYASRQHTEVVLVAEVGIRLGAVYAIDVSDVDLENKAIKLRHRPEGPDVEGTPLKNKEAGERDINISQKLAEIIDDYMTHRRVDQIDEYGRKPLFTSDQGENPGRAAKTTIRRDHYKAMRPCKFSNECPLGRDIDDCRAEQNKYAYDCDVTYSTHPLRRWSITRQLSEGLPKEILSNRVDVSPPVLDKHYDQRDKETKRKNRRSQLENHLDEYV